MNRFLLNEVSEEGVLSTIEGKSWQVNPGDLPTAVCWSPTARLEVENADNGQAFNWKIKNLENDQTILAMEMLE